MLRKSRRFDYIDSDHRVSGFRYHDSPACTVRLLDARGQAEAERFWTRPELLAAWKLLSEMLADWPTE